MKDVKPLNFNGDDDSISWYIDDVDVEIINCAKDLVSVCYKYAPYCIGKHPQIIIEPISNGKESE